MTVYLNKEDCQLFLKKTMATTVDKLSKITKINDKNSEEHKKLLEELTIINQMIECINNYLQNIS
uniref:Uncharacterized protein n=1 Tax=viral metagenome TaxID=1070528 RepID=A0A6C0IES9_9ZZZZ